jgi:hypothetical protein
LQPPSGRRRFSAVVRSLHFLHENHRFFSFIDVV